MHEFAASAAMGVRVRGRALVEVDTETDPSGLRVLAED